MITFTDKRLYPKGICSAQLQDPVTGEVLSQSDKFSTGNIQFSGNIDPLRAGLGQRRCHDCCQRQRYAGELHPRGLRPDEQDDG